MHIFLTKYFLVYVYSITVSHEELNKLTVCHFHNVSERKGCFTKIKKINANIAYGL